MFSQSMTLNNEYSYKQRGHEKVWVCVSVCVYAQANIITGDSEEKDLFS